MNSARTAGPIGTGVPCREYRPMASLIGMRDVLIDVFDQSMEWIELKRSSLVQIHEPLILIQSNPADDPEFESSPVQSGHNRVGIYQIPCNIDM